MCPPRSFVFDNLDDNGSQTITVAERIDCTGYRRVDLMVRVHADASFATDTSIQIQLVADGFTTDDPATEFFSGVLGSGITLSSAALPVAGDFELETISGEPIGSMLAVQVVGQQANPEGEAVNARLSIGLTLRSC